MFKIKFLSILVAFSDENVKKYENRTKAEKSLNSTKEDSSILSIDPGEGSYQLKVTSNWSNRCKTYVDIESREWYRHEYATFSDTDGYTRSGTYDYIPPNGYSPINVDYKPHWTDNTWIKNQALYYYNTSLTNDFYVDAWTHSTPIEW
ncbi:hypothetical protein U473_00115 [Tepidibacillus decaturensis]|uniref:Uncharacterized protein n=1 Tax=Tepidibacillus decaturensis TaxID=1413211 RepID=A0A135L0X0_9BACI|nr:hypothetical protein U473_00115 [Tepidibacillus decaturensis]